MMAGVRLADDLQKLTIRAIVAYAARVARRVSRGLRGVVATELLENALRLIEAVAADASIDEIDAASIAWAGHRVAEAYAEAPTRKRTDLRFEAVVTLVQGVFTVYWASRAISCPQARSLGYRRRAANAAERSVRYIRLLEPDQAAADLGAARDDYEVLLRQYGEHADLVPGVPVACFAWLSGATLADG